MLRRLRGEIAVLDIQDEKGKVIVELVAVLLRATFNQIEKAGLKTLEVPLDYVLGRTTAKAIVHPATGEILAECNTELNTEILAKYRQGPGCSHRVCTPTISTAVRLSPTR